MLRRNIAKFFGFVILIISLVLEFSGCTALSSTSSTGSDQSEHDRVYDNPKTTGRIKSDDIDESSGITASKCQPDVYWTHNDSGSGPFIFAINLAGDNLGT